jgi:site-specific recombinase XerD
MIEGGYGRYVGWLARHSELDTVHPADRIHPDEFTRFVNDLIESGLAPASIANLARALRAYAGAVDPERDWHWLAYRAFRLKARATPRRDKRLRVVHSLELYKLGERLMDEASAAKTEKLAAVQFRDGLMIALLAARPLRLSNFTDIALGSTFVLRDPTYWLVFGEQETKTGRPINYPIPNSLCRYVDEYLRGPRKLLLTHRSPTAQPTTALWISKKGASLTSDQIRATINKRTKIRFGRSVNPHLFRDCLATSLATDDPEAVLCAVPILGHASFKTVEKNYNQATMLTAARDFASEIMQIRNEMLSLFDLEDLRSFLIEAETGRKCQP